MKAKPGGVSGTTSIDSKDTDCLVEMSPATLTLPRKPTEGKLMRAGQNGLGKLSVRAVIGS